ncbi:MAG: GntR family transcriptional regulator [Comamonadaceae bacterium]|nr:GntR family transcriptional regulator [Comamonadaceae bacterium]
MKEKSETVAAGTSKSTRASGDFRDVYARLRRDILSGEMKPGDILNTVHISQTFGVSRTPVREALRMLQTEGLVDAPYQYRMRVKAVSPSEVDGVYAIWILAQALAVGLTLNKTTDPELDELRTVVADMNKITPINARSKSAWEKLHLKYNALLKRHAGQEVMATIESCWQRSERARSMNMRDAPRSWMTSQAEHVAVLRAFERRSALDASRLVSEHLARVALETIHLMDPDYVPVAIPGALAMAAGGSGSVLGPAAAAS